MLQRIERKDAARHRELILNTAKELFNDYGVDSVSMHQIAKSAGVGQGTLYRRYGCKADLCIDLLMESFRLFEEGMERRLAEMAGLSSRKRLSGFLSGWIDFMAEKIQWLSAIKPSDFCPDDRIKYYQSPPCLFMTGIVKRLTEEGIASGEIRGIDADFLGFSMTSALNPDAFLYLMNEEELTVEQIKLRYMELYDRLIFQV